MDSILLGEGVIAIGETDVGITRGGSQFTIEREYKTIEADGDYGPVKGRIRKIRSIAKLVLNAMELLPANLTKMYPAMQIASSGGTDTITAKLAIETVDYNDAITWTGRTLEGRPVIITIENAINLENIDWTLTDKDEVVPQVTYTATYLESARTTEPWSVKYLPVTTVSAGLSALTITNSAAAGVTPTPAFANGVYSYTTSVANAITHVTITPTAASHTIKVNGATVASGATSGNIVIAAGELKLITIVAQETNKTPITYEIRVFRAAS